MNASIGPMPVTVTAEVGDHGAVLTCGTKAYKITHDHCDMHRIWITDVSHVSTILNTFSTDVKALKGWY
jgi:hypothetical protein